LYAWHGDGTGVTSSDGEICKLPGVSCRGGVTVASLDPGYIDLFVGTCWIRLGHDSIVQSRDLIPDSPRTATQSTIVNINGRTHVLIGLMDGRIFVCDTGKPYDAARIQWSTVGGNPRHTGAWRPGLPRAAASLSPAHQ
jgi:hypothetical protein